MSIDAQTIAKQAKHAFDQSQQTLSSSELPNNDADKIRREALLLIQKYLVQARDEIQQANQQDMKLANEQVAAGSLSASLVSRLDLFSKPGKWESMLQGVLDVASLESPLNVCTYAKRLAEATDTSGPLDLYRLTCPIGVLLCIFEARPEVVVNIASLAIKSGNAAILKGGKESRHTATVMSRIISQALADSKLPQHLIQTVETRQDIQTLLQQDQYIDLVIPRGSNELVRSIQHSTRIAVMGHADGLCIGYIHSDAIESITIPTILDAKTDYPAACNSLETVLIHQDLVSPSSSSSSTLWPNLCRTLVQAGVTLYCDPPTYTIASQSVPPTLSHLIQHATESSYTTEFLDLSLAVKSIPSLSDAISHINTFSSHHTDILLVHPENSQTSSCFSQSVNSANVFINASSRFADGFRYGFGTEVGISTGKTHARGPVGLQGLVIYKYILKSQGQGAQTVSDFNHPIHPRQWSHSDIPKEP